MTEVLIIDDEEFFREMIGNMLTIGGYSHQAVDSGQAALELLKTYTPDLILCDVMLKPGMNGFDVLAAVQNDEKKGRVPFIMLTALHDRDNVRKGMLMGADDYLFKPFKTEGLLEAVKKRLEKYELLHGAASRQLDDMKNYFNTRLAHELRTPLAGMMGYLDMLNDAIDKADIETSKFMMQRVKISTQRLHRLVENYMTYSQLSLMRHEQNFLNTLRSNSITYSIHELMQMTAEKRALAYKRLPDLQVKVAQARLAISSDYLTKLVEELVDNAFKFSEEGSPVTVKGDLKEERYVLTVQDHGKGMSAEQVNAIDAHVQFERQKQEQQGVGLGLAIVKEIVAVFDCQMQITSSFDNGTTVTVNLRLVRGFPEGV